MVVGGIASKNNVTWLDQSVREFDSDSDNLVNYINGQLIGKINDMGKIRNLVDNITMLGQLQNDALIKCSIFSLNTDELRNCSEAITSIKDARINQISDAVARHI